MNHRKDFSRRVDQLAKRHSKLSRGMAANMRSDGLIVVSPGRRKFSLPLRGITLLLGFFFLFKGFAFSQLGSEEYTSRVDALRSGSSFHQAGAVALAPDPVTLTIARLIEERV